MRFNFGVHICLGSMVWAKVGVSFMHISEGVLSGPVLVSGMAITAAGTALGLKKLDYDRIARAGILASAFFVASLVHIPIGPSNVHLMMNGIVGVLLGWGAFPVILVALLLQAMLFQFGGITTLGVNTLIMAIPAVACHYLFRTLIDKKPTAWMLAAFSCGFFAVMLSALLLAGALVFTDQHFMKAAAVITAAYVPAMVIEGLVSWFCLVFLKKVHPKLLLS